MTSLSNGTVTKENTGKCARLMARHMLILTTAAQVLLKLGGCERKKKRKKKVNAFRRSNKLKREFGKRAGREVRKRTSTRA